MSYFNLSSSEQTLIDNDFSSCLFILLMHRRSTKNSSSDLAIKLVLQEDEAKESIHCREGKDWGLGASKKRPTYAHHGEAGGVKRVCLMFVK